MQLKNFIQGASIDPVINDNYFARAEETDENFLTKPRARYILSFYAVGLVFAVIIAVMLLMIYLTTKRWDKKLRKKAATKKANKYIKSKIFSVAATTFFINLYALILDGIALRTIKQGNVPINEPYIHALPFYVTAVDIAGMLIWMISWLFSIVVFLRDSDKVYVGLALSTMGPTLSLVVHLPYIAIAFLNDASYATSIFIYYTVTMFTVFGVLELTYGTYQGSIINLKHGPNHNQDREAYCCCPPNVKGRKCVFIIFIPFFTLLVLGFACMITALLVIVPISKAFSDAPARLIGFYQTAIVFVGAYLVYRNFFKKTPSIALAVKEREDCIENGSIDSKEKWDQLSNDEKVTQFYSRLVDIVAKHPTGTPTTQQPNANEGGTSGGAASPTAQPEEGTVGESASLLTE